MAPGVTCTQCGGTDIELDAARGDAVCIQCGAVLEENTIVNEVTFAQDAGGGSSVVGQFVSATPGLRSAGLGFAKESREVAFSNGQRHISQLAAALRLAEHHQEAAQRLFMLAVQHNFIQGRKTQHVIAACLYTVCRREKTAHLLIDYSDVLQTNVYMLGSCFLKFTRMLSLTLPVIDPSLYIHRFASKLEFGDRTHLVSMSALRLVQRMKRDWIQTGRRPSGICGAALLIAARVHGFRRTQREVVRVVRICDMTLRKRLNEFSDTSLGALTARQIETVDLESFGTPADPPSFSRNRAIDAQQQRLLMEPGREAARVRREVEIRSLKLVQLRERLEEHGQSSAGKKPEVLARLLEAERAAWEAETEVASETAGEGGEGGTGVGCSVEGMEIVPTCTALVAALVPVGRRVTFASDTAGEGDDGEGARVAEEMEVALRSEVVLRPAKSCGGDGDGGGDGGEGRAGEGRAGEGGDAGGAAAYPSAWEVADRQEMRAAAEDDVDEEEQQVLMDELNADLDSLDPELEGYLIRDEGELAQKSRVWDEMNKEYLEEQAAKHAARVRMAEARGIDLATAESLLQSEKRRPRKRKNDGGRGGGASSAAEAVEEELRRNRALSSRINYDVVSLLALTEADAPSMPSGDPGGGRGMTMTLGSIGAAMDSEGGGGRGRVSGSEADGFSETLSMGRGSEGSRASSPRY